MIRRLHLITGLVLFAYLLTHLLNLALGLVSIEALRFGRRHSIRPALHTKGR